MQELVERGVVKPEEVGTHRLRHVITNVIGGTESGVKPQVIRRPLLAGDVVLLCSDGLTDMVPDEQIAAVLRAEADPQRACDRLVADAYAAGGRDNVTVVIARYEERAAGG